MPEMRVIGYVRVSTEEQGKEGVSLALQEAKIKEYCRLYELDLARIESDPGFSAKTLDRPGIKSALDDLRRTKTVRKADTHSFDGIVIYKLDRLTRSISNWDQLIQEFFNEKAGKRLFSVSDQIDTRTANGRMFLNLIMTIAQWEREIIAERTAEAPAGENPPRRTVRQGPVRL